MRKLYLPVLFLLILTPAILPAQNTIEIRVGQGGNFYSPKNAVANVGDTVKFIWVTGDHPTRSDDNVMMPLFPMNFSNTTKTFVFTSPGLIPYYCTAHGAAGGVGMSGTITVNAITTSLANKTLANTLTVYPNPASEKINVNFSVRKDNQVSVKLIDVLGNEVATIFNDRLNAGDYKQNLSIPTRVTKGLYFVKVSVGPDVAMRRISIQ